MLADLFTSWAQYVERLSGGNQVIAGAMSLWLLSVITYAARGFPKSVGNFIVRHTTTSMTMNNGGYSESLLMYHFMAWIQPRVSSRFSRTLSIRNDCNENATLGLGYGFHLFFFGGRVFWIDLSKMDSSGSERQKDEVKITTFGRSHEPFRNLLKQFIPKKDTSNLEMYRLDKSGEWVSYGTLPKRSMGTVALPQSLKDEVIHQIEYFKGNREWFYKRGLPYKLAYILYGEPGTGKTSFIRAIASRFDMNVCIMNIHSVTDASLEIALASIPENSILLIEDFDSSSATKNRGRGPVVLPEKVMSSKKARKVGDQGPIRKSNTPASLVHTETTDGVSMFSMLTLTGLLNALDGINPLDNCILFLTTNHLEQVDPALYRKGRIDHLIEIGLVEPEECRRYAQMLYPDYDMTHVPFSPVLGCKLNEALLEGKEDPEKFLACLGLLPSCYKEEAC